VKNLLIGAVATSFLLVILVLLSGCASPAGPGSRLLPWNWFHPDANARMEKATTRADVAGAKTVHAATGEIFKASIAAQALAPGRPKDVTTRFVGSGLALLQQVSPLTAAESADALAIAQGLLSEEAAAREAAEQRQAASETANARLSRDLAAAGLALDGATGKLASANRANAEGAAKYRRLWFWIYAVAGGWLALQAISGLARFYPGLAPIAHFAGSLAAPAVQAAYTRATSGVSKAIADAEKAGNGAAETLRAFLDPRLDTAEQAAIAKPFRATS